MPIRIVRLGSPRAPGEGTRLGTVRRPPRGVRKEDYARENYYDAWLPELSPAAELIASVKGEIDAKRWASFAKAYRRQMAEPPARNIIASLAALSRDASFSVGCYCEDESRCHRSILREILREAGASLTDHSS